jgi:hypothetical protein
MTTDRMNDRTTEKKKTLWQLYVNSWKTLWVDVKFFVSMWDYLGFVFVATILNFMIVDTFMLDRPWFTLVSIVVCNAMLLTSYGTYRDWKRQK